MPVNQYCLVSHASLVLRANKMSCNHNFALKGMREPRRQWSAVEGAPSRKRWRLRESAFNEGPGLQDRERYQLQGGSPLRGAAGYKRISRGHRTRIELVIVRTQLHCMYATFESYALLSSSISGTPLSKYACYPRKVP